MSGTPHTDNMARGDNVVPTWFAKELERELSKMHERIKELKSKLEKAESVKIVRIEFAKENKQ